MTPKTTVANIPSRKTDSVKELSNLIKEKKTILIASIKNLPASQFQEISKSLRGKAIVKVPKKNLIFRAIEESDISKKDEVKKQITDSSALLFSDLDSFDLAAELIENKSPAKAKVGQEAPLDIEIQAGPTDLVPGPAISELGALGIQIQIENGKINIKAPKVIVKEGGKISAGAADIMSKLDIKPFSIGFIPVSSFDTKEGKLYLDIKIDKEATLEELKTAYGKALAFAVEIGAINESTVKIMIQKAASHEKKLERTISGEPEPTPEVVEEKQEDTQPEKKKEEPKADAAEGLASLFG